LKKYKTQLQVGSLNTKKQVAPPTPPATPPQKPAAKPKAEPGTVSAAPANEELVPLDTYGQLIPYADPAWYQSVGLPTT
jgi:hypothetical protein